MTQAPPQTIEVISLGLIPYEEALARQRALLAERAQNRGCDTLLLCEHPEVVTLGRGSHDEAAVAGARAAGLPIIPISRGGQATLHLPGQLVGYPILRLDGRRRDLHALLRLIEELQIQALGDLAGLSAFRREGLTGVWVKDRRGQPRKISSIGIGVERWVSYHGFALNLRCRLERFSLIVPCGLSADLMTSLLEEAGEERTQAFERGFAAYAGPALGAGLAVLDGANK